MQSYCCDTSVSRSFASVKVGQVICVDAFSHLDSQRNFTGSLNGCIHNRGEEVLLPRKRGTATLASDLRDWATKVQIDVIRAVFGNQHRDGVSDGFRVNAIQLN